MVFVLKLLLAKVSCNMGANNTITTASSLSSGAPQRPTNFLNSKYLFSICTCKSIYTELWYVAMFLALFTMYPKYSCIAPELLPFSNPDNFNMVLHSVDLL